MDAATLARFTPVALDLATPGGTVDWGDLAGLRFAEPFFDQTVERWAGGDAPRLVRTDLAALAGLDATPSLDPAALIFHLSRCGSTLASRLLARLPGALVIAEPRPVNTLLLADPAALEADQAARLLRLLVRALGRRRFGDERHYVLKLSSWNLARLDLFRRAFPGAKLIWVQRSPLDVMASVLAVPPSWVALRRAPIEAGRLFGLGAAELAQLDDAGFCALVLASLLAVAAAAEDLMIVDYRELPDAVWTRIAPAIGRVPDADDIARLGEEARYYAKAPGRRLFSGDRADRPALPEALRAFVAERMLPLYDALDARRTRP
ncbi:MAG TPA: hypothetical protein VMA53_27285 [Stellaceae bacterium]|nr:hypothetical protein [Stellaceae bacterium]